MTRSRSLVPFSIPFLLSACASAGGTFAPLGPEHPASAEAPEVAVADPSAVLRAREASFAARPDPGEATAERAAGAFVCPMHPEVASDQAGRCPKCGMKLVAREEEQHEEHDHDG
jgi:hypothetical protein